VKLNEIFAKLEKVAPVSLSDEFCKMYSLYDNSGIIIDSGEDVNGALFSLDLSASSINAAISHGFNLIVTHHPAIYGGIHKIDTTRDPLSANIAKCIKHGISVISMHLNFDAAPKGIDYYLMRGLGGTDAKILASVSGGGYGRVYDIDRQSFQDFAEQVKKTFNTSRVLVYGKDKFISCAASFCGAGCDEKAIKFASDNAADVFVSADMKHHEIASLLERGINVIVLTHYASETYGFNKIYNDIYSGLGVQSEFYCDKELL